ncbi:MAG: alpha/beta hydrolase [Polyangiaceae bacterium]|nr:alpha/beta hydrolase [Polyangiaceae bacterium]
MSLGTARYFGPKGEEVFGWFHPAIAKSRELAVVIVKPLAHEAVFAHRGMRYLARQLAEQGYPVVRLDVHGTLNSTGSDKDPKRLEAWQKSIVLAVREARNTFGITRVALLGIRFGALLAAMTAGGDNKDEIDSLILWAPPLKGRAFARELRAFRLMHEEELGEVRKRHAPDPPREEGHEEVSGFELTKETLDALATVDLTALTFPNRDVLIFPREDGSAEAPLLEAMKASGARTTLKVADKISDLQDPSQEFLPQIVTREILTWLSSLPLATPNIPEMSAVSGPSNVRKTTEPNVLEGISSASSGTRKHGTVRETPLFFGPSDRLFGIFTELEAPPKKMEASWPQKKDVGIVLLNSGPVAHYGSNRLYVRMGRTWASLGYDVLRMDIGGIGESAPTPGQKENYIYSPTSSDDVRAAIKLLRSRGAKRIVCAGICSGAFASFGAAKNLVLDGAMMINPVVFYWKDGYSLSTNPARATKAAEEVGASMGDAKKWKKLLRGEVDIARVSKTVATRASQLAIEKSRTTLSRLTKGAIPTSKLSSDLRTIVDKKCETLLLFSEGDLGVDGFYRDLPPDERAHLERSGLFELQMFPGADHTFTPLWTQPILIERLTEYLERKFP